MYIPAHFAADDATVHELLTRHGAADLITLTADGLLATMLPFAYEPAAGQRGALLGHVARRGEAAGGNVPRIVSVYSVNPVAGSGSAGSPA